MVVEDSSEEGGSRSERYGEATWRSVQGSSSGSPAPAVGESSDVASGPRPARRRTLSTEAASQFDVAEITRTEFVKSTAAVTTLPRAVRRIEQLEARIEMLEERIRDQDTQAEGRVLRSVRGMLAERDRTIERLRFYLEGEG